LPSLSKWLHALRERKENRVARENRKRKGERREEWVGKRKWEEEGCAGCQKLAQRQCSAIKFVSISKSYIDCKLF
jgi:hypothetical protein